MIEESIDISQVKIEEYIINPDFSGELNKIGRRNSAHISKD